MLKICYIDTETGGLDENSSPLLQISAAFEVDWKIVGKFNRWLKPFSGDGKITPESTEKTGFTETAIVTDPKFEDPKKVYNDFLAICDQTVNKFNKKDKMFFVGFNAHTFDMPFMRKFFEKNNNVYFGSYFWWPAIDVMLLYAADWMKARTSMDNFQLMTVAKLAGLKVDEDKLHDGMYDIQLTRELFLRRATRLNIFEQEEIFKSISKRDDQNEA